MMPRIPRAKKLVIVKRYRKPQSRRSVFPTRRMTSFKHTKGLQFKAWY